MEPRIYITFVLFKLQMFYHFFISQIIIELTLNICLFLPYLFRSMFTVGYIFFTI